MKKFYFLIFALFAINSAMAQGCLPEGITFTTQEQIDNFQTDYPGCTEIEGYVLIAGQDIIQLNGLGVLTKINGGLYISNNPVLTSIAALENIDTIGGSLGINNNDSLTKLSGLESLKYVGGSLELSENLSLISIAAFANLTSINGTLEISSCSILKSLTGIDNLISIGQNFYFTWNDSIVDLIPLSNLNSIDGDLWIGMNKSMISLEGLDNLEPSSITNLDISRNKSLATCEVESICNYLSNPNGYVNIYLNGIGCNNPSEVANSCGIELPCLPYGSYYFLSQSDIDNFQENYPGCTELNGYVEISGNNIINLTGLNTVTHIGGNLSLQYNESLTSLTGLNNVSAIYGNLEIYGNSMLSDLAEFENVVFVGGDFWIFNNDLLVSLNGLENIDAASLTKLEIYNNSLLSTCDVQSICDYLSNPDAIVDINNNAPGCNSREEVEYACLVGIQNIIQENKLSIFPNPSSSRFSIQFSLENEEHVKLIVLNNLGQVVSTLANETISEGQHKLNWNAEGMPAGVYFYNIQIGNQAGTGKMVLMK